MKNYSILVVDDDRGVRVMLRYLLEDAGYAVREASNGHEAIDLFHREPADIVITDLFMPEKDGHELIVELKREFPAVKVIAISAIGDTGAYGKNFTIAKALGAEITLYKPLDRENLFLALRELQAGYGNTDDETGAL